MKNSAILSALCCAVLGFCAGCASPGVPQPPSLQLPATVSNLGAVRKGDRVVLSWSQPTETTDHQKIRGTTTTRICRVLNQFPTNVCTPVEQIKSTELASVEPTARRPLVQFEDVLPESIISAKNEATYAVEVLNQRGRSAGLSNQVRVSLVPTLPPPSHFEVKLDAEGPLLEWDVTVGATPAPGVLHRLRISRRKHGDAAFLIIAEEPYKLGEGEARDHSFEWEQQYEYRMDAVTEMAEPGRPVVEVEGNDSPTVSLTAHDIFPPAVPTGLQAVFSSVGQKPFIDLTWAPNTESDLAGYVIFRRAPNGEFKQLTQIPVKAPAWRDNDVRPGETYDYAVAAVDMHGNQSARSAQATERVPRENR